MPANQNVYHTFLNCVHNIISLYCTLFKKNSDLSPDLDYQVYVIAENGITDQVPDRLQSLGTSVTVTTVTRGGEDTTVTMKTGKSVSDCTRHY